MNLTLEQVEAIRLRAADLLEDETRVVKDVMDFVEDESGKEIIAVDKIDPLTCRVCGGGAVRVAAMLVLGVDYQEARDITFDQLRRLAEAAFGCFMMTRAEPPVAARVTARVLRGA